MALLVARSHAGGTPAVDLVESQGGRHFGAGVFGVIGVADSRALQTAVAVSGAVISGSASAASPVKGQKKSTARAGLVGLKHRGGVAVDLAGSTFGAETVSVVVVEAVAHLVEGDAREFAGVSATVPASVKNTVASCTTTPSGIAATSVIRSDVCKSLEPGRGCGIAGKIRISLYFELVHMPVLCPCRMGVAQPADPGSCAICSGVGTEIDKACSVGCQGDGPAVVVDQSGANIARASGPASQCARPCSADIVACHIGVQCRTAVVGIWKWNDDFRLGLVLVGLKDTPLDVAVLVLVLEGYDLSGVGIHAGFPCSHDPRAAEGEDIYEAIFQALPHGELGVAE